MSTFIIVVILLVIIVFSLRSSVKHMKGEGGCCGGGSGSSSKVKKQKLDRVVEVKRMKIEGMKCDNCRKNVEDGLNTMSQVNAKVNLKKKEAVVKLGEQISDDILKKAVEDRGYRVIAIEKVAADNGRNAY